MSKVTSNLNEFYYLLIQGFLSRRIDADAFTNIICNLHSDINAEIENELENFFWIAHDWGGDESISYDELVHYCKKLSSNLDLIKIKIDNSPPWLVLSSISEYFLSRRMDEDIFAVLTMSLWENGLIHSASQEDTLQFQPLISSLESENNKEIATQIRKVIKENNLS